MRVLLIIALAAAGCGGPSTAPMTSAKAVRAETEEDWRGFLSQLAGTPCRWIPGASFLACITPGGEPTTTLIGWEANNRRYVAWRVAPDGAVSVLPGAGGNDGWQFEGPDGRIEFTRSATGWNATGLATATVSVVADAATQPPPPGPAPAPTPKSTESWRNTLEGFTAQWTFNGAAGSTQVHCMWIPSATFLVCNTTGRDGFDLIGWEPHSARYVMYRFSASAVDVLQATRDGRNWTFASKTRRVHFGYDSPIKRTYKDEELVGGSWKIIADGTLETRID